jgi:hypothetical protein
MILTQYGNHKRAIEPTGKNEMYERASRPLK